MHIVIISGLSGAGKSLAIDVLEDLGYYCIDNLPTPLIKDFIQLLKDDKHKLQNVALVIDIRGNDFLDDFVTYVNKMRKQKIDIRLIFLEASKLVLLRRFSETRRPHPLAIGIPNGEAIDQEIERLAPIKIMSDLIVDTSDIKSMELRAILMDYISGGHDDKPFRIIVQSFGFKYGMPQEADFIFDARFIPNPFYEPGLRDKTGLDPDVQKFVLGFEDSIFFLDEIVMLIQRLKPSYIREGKSTLNIAFGCTGGMHRSVTLAIEFSNRLIANGEKVVLRHREI